MERSVMELMDEFISTATPESIIEDCKTFGVKLTKIDEFDTKYQSEVVGEYTKTDSSSFTCTENEYCLAA